MPWHITSVVIFIIGFVDPAALIIIYEKLDKIHNTVFDLILGMK